MHTLDNLARLGQLDKERMLESIALLPRQIEQAWAETKKLKFSPAYKKIDKVVINGMGGSGLGTHIIRSIYFKDLKVSLANIHGYDLPGLVDKNTLYIISSYSGETEEPLTTLKAAKKRGAKILGITAGGELAELIQAKQIPGYIFEPKHNPCNQPRLGLGYSIGGILGLLSQCGVVKIKDQEISSAVNLLDKLNQEFSPKNPLAQNSAKKMADSLYGKIPVVVASEFLAGNAHALANQINENAKNFSAYFIISELNHHLLEGLSYPASNHKNIHFVFLESNLYYSRNQKRFAITKDIVAKNKIQFSSFFSPGETNLEQSFAALLFGSYVSFYLAIMNGLDPSLIPFVDYLKEKLNN